jgi:hypothetical protein
MALDIDGNTTVLRQEPLLFSLGRHFLGITSYNEEDGFSVLVNSISLDGPPRIADVGRPEIRSYKLDTANNSVGVLELFDSLMTNSEHMAASSDLCGIMASPLVPVVNEWQRRLTVIGREIGGLKEGLLAELNRTVDKIGSVRDVLESGFFELKQEVSDVESQLTLGVLKGFHLDKALINAKKSTLKDKFMRRLLQISIIEVAAALCFVGYKLVAEALDKGGVPG